MLSSANPRTQGIATAILIMSTVRDARYRIRVAIHRPDAQPGPRHPPATATRWSHTCCCSKSGWSSADFPRDDKLYQLVKAVIAPERSSIGSIALLLTIPRLRVPLAGLPASCFRRRRHCPRPGRRLPRHWPSRARGTRGDRGEPLADPARAAATLELVDELDVAARPEEMPLSPGRCRAAVAPPSSETGANGPPAPMFRNFSAVARRWWRCCATSAGRSCSRCRRDCSR